MVITGAQIIDLMMLVVDITKGMQTQTAEVSGCGLAGNDYQVCVCVCVCVCSAW